MIARSIAACVATMVIAACTTTPPAGPPLPVPVPPPETATTTRPYPRPEEPTMTVPLAEPSALARALDYYSRLKQRSARDQRAEYEALRKSFAASRSDHDRMRLALLLSLTNATFGDDNQALELLEPLVRDPASEYHGLAHLLVTLLSEQRRLERQTSALQQKLERIRALEKEMQQRAATPESKRQ